MNSDSFTTQPELDNETFLALREVMSRTAGLAFREETRFIFQSRLKDRLLRLGISSFSEYLELVKAKPHELGEVYELLTTKETYFFRQEYQLKAFIDEVLPTLAKDSARTKRLTIWSAGCSTGEEVFTLAILLSEVAALRDFRIAVVGTDLCESNITHAQKSIYRAGSFRTTSPARTKKYFDQVQGGLRPKEFIRRLCHFSVVNLLTPSQVRRVGRIDAIFCRNVLIYFDARAREQVVAQFFQRLIPGGYLFLGHSENLLNSRSPFTARNLSVDIAYQRLTPTAQKELK